jgi:hypothetical protein
MLKKHYASGVKSRMLKVAYVTMFYRLNDCYVMVVC